MHWLAGGFHALPRRAPPHHPPPPACQVARRISPSMRVGPSAAPFMLMPVVAGCNQVHVARPGHEPSMTAEPMEDMRLLGPELQAPDGELVCVCGCRGGCVGVGECECVCVGGGGGGPPMALATPATGS